MQRLRTHAVDAQAGVLFDQLDNRILSIGAGAPTAGLPGYLPGSLYIDTTGKSLYKNTGTVDSSTWTLIS
jgi:hypothetical protein